MREKLPWCMLGNNLRGSRSGKPKKRELQNVTNKNKVQQKFTQMKDTVKCKT